MAKDVGGLVGLAGRYANALFELADESKQLDEVAADLEGLKKLLGQSDDLDRLVRSPVLSRPPRSNPSTQSADPWQKPSLCWEDAPSMPFDENQSKSD